MNIWIYFFIIAPTAQEVTSRHCFIGDKILSEDGKSLLGKTNSLKFEKLLYRKIQRKNNYIFSVLKDFCENSLLPFGSRYRLRKSDCVLCRLWYCVFTIDDISLVVSYVSFIWNNEYSYTTYILPHYLHYGYAPNPRYFCQRSSVFGFSQIDLHPEMVLILWN